MSEAPLRITPRSPSVFAPITLGAEARSRESAGLRLIETVHAPNVKLGPHDHEDPSIVAAIEGCWEEKVQSRAFVCKPGSFLLKPAGANHTNIYGSEQTRSMLIQLSVTRAASWEPSRKAFRDCSYLESSRIAMKFMAFLTRPNEHSTLEIEEEVCALLSLFSLEMTPRRRKGQLVRHLETTRDELLEEPDKNPQLTDLAARCGLSPSAFTHAFRAEFGCTPSALVRRRRIERASLLLRSTRWSLSRIAAATGFADQAHFTREFRRIVRASPGEFRQAFAS